MAGYITRFGFGENNPFATQLVPIKVAVVNARETRTKLLAFWFTASFRDVIAVWDSASEQAVHAMVEEVASLGGITCETVCAFSDEELTQQVLAR